MTYSLKLKCDSFHPSIIGKIYHNKFETVSLHSGRQLTFSSGGNASIEKRRDVDPFLFAFHKWGITWNSVGLFFAFMTACYWNIFTRDGSLGIVIGLEVFLLSLVFPSQFFSLFQGLTKTSLAEWYVNQGYKVEQQVRKSPLLGMGIFLLLIGLCLAMFMGDSTVREDASLVLRIFRGITYPYLALALLFRGTLPMNDPGLFTDIANAIKTILKYSHEKPGKTTAMAAIGGSFAIFSYFAREKEKARQEALEMGKQLQEDERRELSLTEQLVRESPHHPDHNRVLMEVVEYRNKYDTLPPFSAQGVEASVSADGLQSLAKRVQEVRQLHTEALRLGMISKPGETAKVVDYGESPKSPFEDHFNWGDWGDWVVSFIM